jgi:hypothetical protein
MTNLWIAGATLTGKTSRLVVEFDRWIENKLSSKGKGRSPKSSDRQLGSGALILAANDDNKKNLADRLSSSIDGRYPVIVKTTLGFISDEVMLFWPLLFDRLNLKAQFPLRLRPETEQELATRLWRPYLEAENLGHNDSESKLVRRTLDLLQLAGASGVGTEDIPVILEQGLPPNDYESSQILNSFSSKEDIKTWKRMGELLLEWRNYCLDRGLLGYGLVYELYWRYLLCDPTYQKHLLRRYQAIFADDVDDYPAIAKDIFAFLLDRGVVGVFTYNPDGKVRVGLNADPHYLENLADRCQIEKLTRQKRLTLAPELSTTATQMVSDPLLMTRLPDSMQSIQTISRAELLRTTAELAIDAITKKEIKPEEIAIIAPGLDEIARYTLIEIFTANQIPVLPLNEQRPLISSPLIRALLTLLGLIYPGLGRLVDRDAVAEMLVVLSHKPREGKLVPDIDPVRAGLLADHCYHVDLEHPHLLPIETFPRWDRLGYKATNSYQTIMAWLEKAKQWLETEKFPNPVFFLDRAVKQLLSNSNNLPFDRLSALRELMETAQHYWEVDRRVRINESVSLDRTTLVAQFIQLLRRGTITANPRPLRSLGKKEGAITLANIFQYRSLRSFHRWQFWLDAGSPLWDKGGAATLFAAPLFLKEWSGRTWLPEHEYEGDRLRLERIIRDLLGRTGERVYLCHSDLGVNGTEQMGPLLTLVHASRQFVTEKVETGIKY